jgi:hypothetical protein
MALSLRVLWASARSKVVEVTSTMRVGVKKIGCGVGGLLCWTTSVSDKTVRVDQPVPK